MQYQHRIFPSSEERGRERRRGEGKREGGEKEEGGGEGERVRDEREGENAVIMLLTLSSFTAFLTSFIVIFLSTTL